jgi:RNA polymerase sigma factor (sigma-70 family)
VRTDARIEGLLRQLAPQVLGALVRRDGDFDACEDAVQEALLAAATSWPVDGLPDDPRAWLVAVASRRRTDALRAGSARRRREDREVAERRPLGAGVAAGADAGPDGGLDETLALLFLCCDPALTTTSQMALTLRAVGGLTTAEIAAAFLVPESTMGQRISRAKQTLRDRGLGTTPVSVGDPGRLAVVLHVLYLVFNEGYSASAGEQLERRELAGEAIRLARTLHVLAPDDPEVAGLLALMVLTDARHAARAAPDGSIVALADQDRSLWDRALVDEGVALVEGALARGRVGPYQLQAAIAAVHDEAATVDDTDWEEIAGLYRLLERVAPGPVLTLNRAVAVGHAQGPDAGLALLASVADDPRVAGSHRLHAVRAHLLEMSGDRAGARDEYVEAARRATSVPERAHLRRQARRLTDG